MFEQAAVPRMVIENMRELSCTYEGRPAPPNTISKQIADRFRKFWSLVHDSIVSNRK